MPLYKAGMLSTGVAAVHVALTPPMVMAQEGDLTAFVRCQENGVGQSLEVELVGLITAIEEALPEGHAMKGRVETMMNYPVSLDMRAALVRGLAREINNADIGRRLSDISMLQRAEEESVARCLAASGALKAGVTYIDRALVGGSKRLDGLFTAKPAATTGAPVEVQRGEATVMAMSAPFWDPRQRGKDDEGR